MMNDERWKMKQADCADGNEAASGIERSDAVRHLGIGSAENRTACRLDKLA